MNNYRKNHPDPEIRQKYEEWEAAMMRAGKLKKPEEVEQKRQQRRSLPALLKAMAPTKVKSKTVKQTSKRLVRTGGQRGS